MNTNIVTNNKVKTTTKLLISIVALASIITLVPLNEILSKSHKLSFLSIGALLILVIVREIFTSYSLKTLVENYLNTNILTIMTIDAIDYVANTFLPTRFGTVVSTPLLLNKVTGIPKKDGFIIKVTQIRLIGAINSVVIMLGLLITSKILPRTYTITLFLVLCIYIFITISPLILNVIQSNSLTNSAMLKIPVTHKFKNQVSFNPGKFSKKALIKSGAFLVIGNILISGVRFGLIARELNINFPIYLYMFIPIMAYSVSIIPISFGGIGITELSGTLILISFGINTPSATTLIFLDRAFGAYIPILASYAFSTLSLKKVLKNSSQSSH